MKKAMPILLILGFLGLILQVAVNVFISEKMSEYTLKTSDNSYNITEHMEVIDNISYYDIGITDKDGIFYSLFIEEDFNKQTEVIRDIKTFKSNNLSCIFPIYRRNVTGNVTCLYNGESASYSYLKQNKNKDLESIVSKLKEEKYSHNSWDRKESTKTNLYNEGRQIDVYQDNILSDYVFLIWRYKGLYILKSDKSLIKDYLDADIYDNSMSAIAGRYYVTADRRSLDSSVSSFYYYNTKDLGKGSINMDEATSSDVYFNGVYDEKVYMTDIKNKKQYTIDPAYEKVVVVGNETDGFVSIVDGKKKKVDATEFLKEKVYFNGFVSNEKLTEKYGDKIEIKKDRDFYYFKTSDGKMYMAHEDKPDKAELLFKLDKITEWKVKNGDLLLAAGNTVYFYNEHEGLLPIAYNKELSYNNKNIIDFWKM